MINPILVLGFALMSIACIMFYRHGRELQAKLTAALADRRKYMLIEGMNYVANMVNDYLVLGEQLPRNPEELLRNIRRGGHRFRDPDTEKPIKFHYALNGLDAVTGALNFQYFGPDDKNIERVEMWYLDPRLHQMHKRVIRAAGTRLPVVTR